MKDLSEIVQQLPCVICSANASGIYTNRDAGRILGEIRVYPIHRKCHEELQRSINLAARIGSEIVSPGQLKNFQNGVFIAISDENLVFYREPIMKFWDEYKTRQVIER